MTLPHDGAHVALQQTSNCHIIMNDIAAVVITKCCVYHVCVCKNLRVHGGTTNAAPYLLVCWAMGLLHKMHTPLGDWGVQYDLDILELEYTHTGTTGNIHIPNPCIHTRQHNTSARLHTYTINPYTCAQSYKYMQCHAFTHTHTHTYIHTYTHNPI